jgi:hypothetical protein
MKSLATNILLLAVLSGVTGCVSVPSVLTGSPKGRPEVIVQHADIQAVADECAHWLLQNDFTIDFTNPYTLGGSQFAENPSPIAEFFGPGAHVEVDLSYAPEGDNVHVWGDIHLVSAYYGDAASRQWLQEELVTLAKSVAPKK